MTTVAIIGTGLLGASIGLGLKAAGKIPNLEVVGSDRRQEHLRAARSMGAIDRAESDPAKAVRGAALVVLAVPVLGLYDVMEDVADALEPGAVVTDTGSTKTDVMRWARELIPAETSFVGGHPMAGKTDSGPSAATADLFQNAQWILVPSVNASEGAVTAVAGLAESLGAKPRYMDAEEHDAYVAAISHLPLMASTALFRLTRDSEAWPEMSLLAAGGFKDTTRVAGTHPDMAHDIVVTNRTQIIHWLERYRESLRELQQRIADVEDEEGLYRYLAQTSMEHDAFMSGQVGRVEVDQKGNMPEGGMDDFIFGSYIAERMRDITKRSEDRLAEREREEQMRREH
ncbi:MAG: prephenate dehydrogenase/arogenate dehydrogenase family protein [Dehalococcoidia bacterium]